MSYSFFFLALSGVAVVVFIAIFEAGWLSRNDFEAHNSTEIPIKQHREIFMNIDGRNLSHGTDKDFWTTDPEKHMTTWKASEETKLPDSSWPSNSPTTSPKLITIPNLIPAGVILKSNDKCAYQVLTEEADEIKWEQQENKCYIWYIDLHTMCSGVDITIEKLVLNELLDEYLIIAPNANQLLDNENPILTSKLLSKRKFRMLGGGTMYIMLMTNSTSSGPFSFTYKCYGKGSVTTEEPTTEYASTPGPETDEMITIYLKGKTQYEFASILYNFQSIISDMATSYSKSENISLEEPPTPNSTFFTYIGPCPINWPESKICVHIRMGVFLNTTEKEYELTALHLQEMWNKNGKHYIKELGLQVYDPPDDGFYLLGWIATSLGIVLLFILLLGAMWYWQPFRVYNKMKEDEPYEQTPRITEIHPTHSAILYEPDSIADYLPPKSPGVDSSTDDIWDVRNSIAQMDTIPKYGQTTGFGGAIHFYGKRHSQEGFEDLGLVVQEENKTTNQPILPVDERKRAYAFVTDRDEEVDTSKLKYFSVKKNSLNNIHLNTHYEDEPKGYKNLAYTDDEKTEEKSPGKSSEQTKEDFYGKTPPPRDAAQGYDMSYRKTEGDVGEDAPRHSFKENSTGTFLMNERRASIHPSVIEEEEEESQENTLGSNIQSFSPLVPLTGAQEDDSTELNNIGNEEGSRSSARSSGENQPIYDVPKFPMRKYSEESNL